jgi:hypothetical protein
MRVTITKLGHRKDAYFNADVTPYSSMTSWSVPSGDSYEGTEVNPPEIGSSYHLRDCSQGGYLCAEYFHSSTVKSIYIHDSEDYDKLVLPIDFPKTAIHLNIPIMEKGEMLLATMNSVYLVQPAKK